MLSIRNTAAMAHALDMPIDTDLKCLLRRRVDQLSEHDGYDLSQLAHFVVVQAGDCLCCVEAELGFSPLANFVDDARYNEPGFTPSFEWIEDHSGWFELVFVLSDDGFGVVLLVEESEGVDPELLALCREYSDKQSADTPQSRRRS